MVKVFMENWFFDKLYGADLVFTPLIAAEASSSPQVLLKRNLR